jgi:hypothetical protein
VLKESAKNEPQYGVVALPNRGIRLILMFGLLASSAPSSPQDSKPDSIVDDFSSMAGVIQLACIDGKWVLRNEDNFLVVLDTDELERRAIHRASIEAEKGFASAEPIDVHIAIDEAGRVLCASLTEQSRKRIGFFEANAIETAKKWLFQPVLKDGRPILCVGYLELKVVDRATMRGRVRRQ